MSAKVTEYIRNATHWKKELKALRKVLLECGLSEDLKWGKPCYMHEEHNVVVIQAFKSYFALLFFKGVLLKDPEGILQKTGKNTEVGRQIRFLDSEEIEKLAPTIKKYIREAIKIEKAGLKVDTKAKAKPQLPQELKSKFKEVPKLKAAFEALTPGRQKGYCIYFSSAKQPKTREARIEKSVSKILAGVGVNDR